MHVSNGYNNNYYYNLFCFFFFIVIRRGKVEPFGRHARRPSASPYSRPADRRHRSAVSSIVLVTGKRRGKGGTACLVPGYAHNTCLMHELCNMLQLPGSVLDLLIFFFLRYYLHLLLRFRPQCRVYSNSDARNTSRLTLRRNSRLFFVCFLFAVTLWFFHSRCDHVITLQALRKIVRTIFTFKNCVSISECRHTGNFTVITGGHKVDPLVVGTCTHARTQKPLDCPKRLSGKIDA